MMGIGPWGVWGLREITSTVTLGHTGTCGFEGGKVRRGPLLSRGTGREMTDSALWSWIPRPSQKCSV